MIERLKGFLNKLFVDGLSGMALGLFATLIIGTIIQQIAGLFDGAVGDYMFAASKMIMTLTGAGIGCGVACKFKETPLVLVSAGMCGMIGAFASKIIGGTLIAEGGIVQLSGGGEPLGAFIAAFVGIEIGHLVSGKTKLDILLTPIVTIASGGCVGLLVGPPISRMIASLGDLINWGVEQQPILMGLVVSVIMGMLLTLPISSAAIGVMLNLSGIAAGAATVGCCANMIGFAVASYRDNKIGGLFAQGIGTSMLQMPNIVKKPIIWLPAIVSSAVLGPIGAKLLGMAGNAVGSGMGTAGLVGPIMSYQTMIAGSSQAAVLIKIALMYFILPAALALLVSELMRKIGWIKPGDMKLDTAASKSAKKAEK